MTMAIYNRLLTRSVKKSILISFVLLCLIALFVLTRLEREYSFSGNTMGTTYHIKVVTRYFFNTSHLKKKVDKRLDDINKSMSTYIRTSEITGFNQSTDIDKEYRVSSDFLFVMTMAEEIYRLTRGAWDGTVKPLVDLWGFSNAGRQETIPDREKIQTLLQAIGFHWIYVSKDGYLRKKIPQITVDLASIAKGYAVDEISKLIRQNGMDDFIVEIGGEVYGSGVRKDKQPWRVGINAPRSDAPSDLVYEAVSLHDKAMATSGDYRNFFEKNGIRYSHILDPKTGYPVKNGVVSVSVISDNCTFADGLATGLMVMGPDAGIELTNRLPKTECLIIVQNADGSLSDHYSTGFPH
jgi:FAD:protein FMN transferase